MTAPALVMVASGGTDPRVAQIVHAIRQGIQSLRPEMIVQGVFLDDTSGTHLTLTQLARQGVLEAVLVPLDVTHACDEDPRVRDLVAWANAACPELAMIAARPIGPEVSLLSILDLRVRAALAAGRVLELDGLVLCSPSAGDLRGASLLARRARQWATHHRLPCLTAVADGSGTTVAQAIQSLRAQGRRHIAVGSFFLTAEDGFSAQADLARRCGAVAVSEPMGFAREVLDLIMARYAFAAMDLLEDEGDTDAETDEGSAAFIRDAG